MQLIKKIDSGWLYLVPGLVLVIFAMVLPAVKDKLTAQLIYQDLEMFSKYQYNLEESYSSMINALETNNTNAIKRIEALDRGFHPSQISLIEYDLIPNSPESWILQQHVMPSMTDIEASLPNTLLMKYCCGKKRVWVITFGLVLIFIGIFSKTLKFSK